MILRQRKIVRNRPSDFVNIKDIIPQIQVDLAYHSIYNFIGNQIPGYEIALCLITKKAAYALKEIVDNDLLPRNLTLKVYDCYRPQSSVDYFAAWAKQINNTKMQAEFYPDVLKENLFKNGYISLHSAHSRGSTIDLTIIAIDNDTSSYEASLKEADSILSYNKRLHNNTLDFGTAFDYFSELSHPTSLEISTQARANRLLLEILMKKAGFRPFSTEWWHFTLIDEPYPDIYYDFPITVADTIENPILKHVSKL